MTARATIRKVCDLTLEALRNANHACQERFASMEEDPIGVPQQVFSPVIDPALLMPTTSTPRQSYYTTLPEFAFHGEVGVTSPRKEPKSLVSQIADIPPYIPPFVITHGPSAAGAADAHPAGVADAHAREQSETTEGSVVDLS